MKPSIKKRTLSAFLAFYLMLSYFVPVFPVYATTASDSENTGMLMNGSFEQPLFGGSAAHTQLSESAVPYWNTTAETKKIEFFKANSYYVKDAVLKPYDGVQAVELNADEESSLYQIVNTEPSSLYEWGIAHGSRTAKETMALIIGPDQVIAPSKNWGEGYETADLNYPDPPLRVGYKYGKDQMMQMVAWLKATGRIASSLPTGIANDGNAIILYSKKFAAHGEFQDNLDNQPFSMEPSSVYTEKWCIWIMTDERTTVNGAENTWTAYGLNGDQGESGAEIDLDKYYLYNVPSGQTKTMFSFTSVDNSIAPGKTFIDPTFGNFLDGVNFHLYHSLSGSTTNHGSAVVGNSDGSSSGEGSSFGHQVTVESSVATYVQDGQALNIQANVAAADTDSVNFVGVYCTVQDPNGYGSKTSFISLNDIHGQMQWTLETTADGDKRYSYSIPNVTYGVSLHFVFVKAPYLTYDVNGGKPYSCLEGTEASENSNIYGFKPDSSSGEMHYIDPYKSHLPEGQTDAWKFMGWQLFDDNGESVLLPAVHSIACNYQQKSGSGTAATQQFVAIDENGIFIPNSQTVEGKTWSTSAVPLYNDLASGLSLVAQWRWRQTIISQMNSGSGFITSSAGGTISYENVTDSSDENYVPNYSATGAKAYYAGVNETIAIKAVPNSGYYFDGWYDESGTLVSTGSDLSYVVAKEEAKTYYARFSKTLDQHFKRQIQLNGVWITLDDTDTSKVPVLDHANMSEGIGTTISCTATNNASYGIIGWYDGDGADANRVDEGLIFNNGKTISYSVTEEKTYYARYEQAKTVQFALQLIQVDGTVIGIPNNSSTYKCYLTNTSTNAVPGDIVSSKAYPGIGYKFVGWFTADGIAVSGNLIDSSDTATILFSATENITYYARFEGKTDVKYAVRHYFKDWSGPGTNVLLDQYTYYGTTGEAVMPTITQTLSQSDRVGYVYSSGMPSAPEKILADGSKIFSLYYTKTPVTLRYDANAGADAVTGSVADTAGYVGCNSVVSANGFERSGFVFLSWNTDPNGGGIAYSPNEAYMMLAESGAVNPNVLYAQWATEADVIYTVQHIKIDKNGQAIDSVGYTEKYTYTGETGDSVSATQKAYTGYSFDETNAGNTVSGNITGDGSLVLKLYYKPNPTTLTYKPNGGVGSEVIQGGFVDEQITVSGNLFTRPGYTFSSWKTVSGTNYKANSSYTLTTAEDVLLAQWTANANTPYKVQYYKVSANGSSCILTETVNKTGATGATVSATEENGMVLSFDGYTYKSDFNASGMKTSATGLITGDGSLVLKLYYIPNSTTITYKPNGGDGTDIISIGRVGENVSVVYNTFVKPGYTFKGWNTESVPSVDMGTEFVQGVSYALTTEPTVLYAQWKANPDTPYTVEHYKLNSTNTIAVCVARESYTGTTGSEVTATEKSYKGYTYIPNFSSDGMTTTAIGVITGDGSLVLKLYYIPDKAYFHYKSNDGTSEEQIIEGKVDEAVGIIQCPFVRDGYRFVGWNTVADPTKEQGATYQPIIDSYMLTADENVLYAQWEKVDYVHLSVEWGDMQYSYQDKTMKWNPDTHQYELSAEGAKEWNPSDIDGNNNRVTVKNYSDISITVQFAFSCKNQIFNSESNTSSVSGFFFQNNADAMEAAKNLSDTSLVKNTLSDNKIIMPAFDKSVLSVEPTKNIFFAFAGTPDIGTGNRLVSMTGVGSIVLSFSSE